MTENKPIIDKVNVKECKYYCNGKCERYEKFVEADYANYSVKCICEKENDLGTYDICDYQQLSRKTQECEKKSREIGNLGYKIKNQRKEINERLKQLKAKEQECENWKETANQYAKNEEYYRCKSDQLKSENKYLKANSTKWKTFDVSFHDGFVKTQISDMSLAEYSQLKLEKQQAEQKLERIRELTTALCYTVMSDGVAILQKDILKIIDGIE